jgi:hypothetical protein
LQGRKAGKLFMSFALAFALVLTLGAGAAYADPTIDLNKTEAKTTEAVEVAVANLEVDDIWEVWVDDRPAETPTGDPIVGQAESPDAVKKDLQMPDLGNTDKDVDVKLFVTRPGVGTLPEATKSIRYIAAVDAKGEGGGTGSGSGTTTGGTATSTPAAITGPTGIAGPAATGTTGGKSKKTTKKAKAKSKSDSGGKSKSDGGSDKKSSGNNSGGGSGGGSSTPTYTAPATSATPTSSLPSGSFDSGTESSSSSPPPVDPPPGVGGPPTSPEGVPEAPPPVPPTGQAPIVPVANAGDEGSGLPIALVLGLGLLTLLGLGGAQTRMLGFWGPPVPAGRGAQDARLVALGRVAESQASLQKKIAEHKHAVKHKEPV